MLAIALVWIAAHEGMPAGRLPRQVVYCAAVAASLAVVFITLLTFWASPSSETMHVSPWLLSFAGHAHKVLRVSPWTMHVVCGTGSTLAGGILVLLFSWVRRDSFAVRPSVVGPLYGAGAGLAINGGWRIACGVSTPWHALGAHGAAIFATAVLGVLIGRFWGNRRLGRS